MGETSNGTKVGATLDKIKLDAATYGSIGGVGTIVNGPNYSFIITRAGSDYFGCLIMCYQRLSLIYGIYTIDVGYRVIEVY